MRKLLVLSAVVVFIFTGCSKPKEIDTKANDLMNKKHAIQDISEEDVKINPEVIILTYNDAIKRNSESETLEGTYGGSPVIWHSIKVDDVEYHYVEMETTEDESSSGVDQTPVSYSVVGSDYSLNCGIEVGMTSNEVLSQYPDLVRSELDNKYEDNNTTNSSLGFNGAAYLETGNHNLIMV